MAKLKKEELIFLIIYFLLCAILFRGYFLNELPTGTDALGLPTAIEGSRTNDGFFSSWIHTFGLGYPDSPSPIYGLFFTVMSSLIQLSSVDVSKLLMVGSFLVAGISTFYVVKKLTHHHYAAFAAALVLVLNQSFLSQVADGHYYFVASMGVFPIVFYFLYRVLDQGLDRTSIISPVVFVAYGMIAPPNIIIMAVIFLMLFTIIFWIVKPFPPSRALFASGALILILVFVTLGVELANGIPAYQTRYSLEETVLWSNQSLIDALRLSATEDSFMLGSSLPGWVIPTEMLGIAVIMSILVALAALIAPFFKEKRPLAITLVICSILMAFLAKGPNGLLNGPFLWAFENIPLFDSIRVFSRFTLLIGFCYSLLIGLLISNLDSMIFFRCPSIKCGKHTRRKIVGAMITILVAISLILPSTAVFFGAVGGFNLPAQYSAPFRLISDDDSDYRVLNLPYDALYYDRGPRLFNYTDLFTLDPGTYSPLYSGKDIAYGTQSNPFWYYIGNTIQSQRYGYLDMTLLLGRAASVKYVVGQVHASASEKSLFESLNGMTIVNRSSDGWIVFNNEYWQPRVNAYSSFALATGGRCTLSTAFGCGLIDSTTSAVIFLSDIKNQVELQKLAGAADMVVIKNGDLTELLVETCYWSTDQRLFLSTLSNVHSDNSKSNWVLDNRPIELGITPYPGLVTRSSLQMELPFSKGEGEYELLLKVVKAPGKGLLNISVGGTQNFSIDLDSPVEKVEWVSLPSIKITGSSDRIALQNSGPIQVSLEQAILVTSSEMAEKIREFHDIWDVHADKFIYLFEGLTILEDADGWERSLGKGGWGIAPTNGAIKDQPISLIDSGDFILTLFEMDDGSGTADISIDGHAVSLINKTNGTSLFELEKLEIGSHEISIRSEGLYAFTLAPKGLESQMVEPSTIEFEKISEQQYVTKTNSTTNFVLGLSENFNSLWVATIDGKALDHIALFSQVNGYIVPSGSHEIVIQYQGQVVYHWIIFVSFGSTALMVVAIMATLRWYERLKDDDTMAR